MNRAVVPADLDALVRAVGAALDGDGPAVAPVPVLADAAPGDDVALVLRTSGSTGAPREVALGRGALRASGDATHARLGGPGHWLLTLPPTHVAGVQVVARAHAGLGLTAARAGEPFTPDDFAALVARTPRGVRRYVSLVPTQLHRLVTAADAGDGSGLDALCALDGVLLGGAATPAPLLRRARAAGARIVTTYGMTETCGGCVYDGVPLAGVRARLVAGSGVVELSGPVLSDGYLGDAPATAAAFRTDPDGTRWFRTSDVGRVERADDHEQGRVHEQNAGGQPVRARGGRAASGQRLDARGGRAASGHAGVADTLGTTVADDGGTRLVVVGRADDVVVSGGVNVAPAAVEDVVAHVEGVGEVCVVGVPDPEWGQAVVAVVTLAGRAPAARDRAGDARDPAREARDARDARDRPGAPTSADAELVATVRARVADRLGRAAAPRRVLVVADLPRRGPGKVDRAAVARLAVGHDGT